jgi:hypothetical protein
LDPLWSTDTVRFVHDGCEATRTEKVQHIAASPLVLATLRVCWPDWGEEYNCGSCEKCIRTMLGLHLAGALSRSETFPRSLDARLLRNVGLLTGESSVKFFEDLRRALDSGGADQKLTGAVRHVLRRERLKFWVRRRVPSPIRRAIGVLRRPLAVRAPRRVRALRSVGRGR